ncbi:MAG: hypothetical protein VW397_02740 [Candidatus Margulisiibacteriota bacterium]
MSKLISLGKPLQKNEADQISGKVNSKIGKEIGSNGLEFPQPKISKPQGSSPFNPPPINPADSNASSTISKSVSEEIPNSQINDSSGPNRSPKIPADSPVMEKFFMSPSNGNEAIGLTLSKHFLKLGDEGAISNQISQMSEIANDVFSECLQGKDDQIQAAVTASTEVQKSLNTDGFLQRFNRHLDLHDTLTLSDFGCKRHNAGLNVYKDGDEFTVVLCNRGLGSKKGMFVEKNFKSKDDCRNFVNKLIQLKVTEETMTPIYERFETDGKLKKVEMDQDAQVTGNCGWANKEAALKELTFRKTKQIDVYKNFRSQMRDHVASYIEHTGNKELGKELEFRKEFKTETEAIKSMLTTLNDVSEDKALDAITSKFIDVVQSIWSETSTAPSQNLIPMLKRIAVYIERACNKKKNNLSDVNFSFLIKLRNLLQDQPSSETRGEGSVKPESTQSTSSFDEIVKSYRDSKEIRDRLNSLNTFDSLKDFIAIKKNDLIFSNNLKPSLTDKIKTIFTKVGGTFTENGAWITDTSQKKLLFELSNAQSLAAAKTLIDGFKVEQTLLNDLETVLSGIETFDGLKNFITSSERNNMLYSDLTQKEMLNNKIETIFSSNEVKGAINPDTGAWITDTSQKKLLFELSNAQSLAAAKTLIDGFKVEQTLLNDLETVLSGIETFDGLKNFITSSERNNMLYSDRPQKEILKNKIKTIFISKEVKGVINPDTGAWITNTSKQDLLFSLTNAESLANAQTLIQTFEATKKILAGVKTVKDLETFIKGKNLDKTVGGKKINPDDFDLIKLLLSEKVEALFTGADGTIEKKEGEIPIWKLSKKNIEQQRALYNLYQKIQKLNLTS